ncbi:helix-turn-helix domain-containing protein [Convivina intestini]|uniref:Helix-turn-helix protein n=1 Tax=Convivina intestini TaxID=1505726 RepID=A0A2U1D9I6_9LACO|nr:helix-turn-helix transcriptional regulator [Convivina intestini]PVY84346.1 helix-turn-helix protein [Convivina intestini]SDC06587.1 Helix-turn-helix [Leuconostocaceae bacterium R-53105]
MDKTKVTALRKAKGWTQEDLAERAYITVRTIQRLEAGQEVSTETLSSVANALGVTITDLFEYIDTEEREIELMASSQEQQVQFSRRTSEATAIKLALFAVIFTLLSCGGLFVESRPEQTQNLFGVLWLFSLFIGISSGYYFYKIIVMNHLDAKYPKTLGVAYQKRPSKPREPIENVWQFLANYWWLIFPIGGFLSWLVPHLMGR